MKELPIDRFRRACKDVGLGVPYVPSVGDMFELRRLRLLGCIEVAKRKLLPGKSLYPIQCDYFSSGYFNAVACVIEGQAFIGLPIGAVLVPHEMLWRLLSHPQVLQNVGDPTKEAVGAQHAEGVYHDFDDLVRHRSASGQPRDFTVPIDPVRRAFAELASLVAFDFLISHELAHITHGHLGGSACQSPLINERALGRSLVDDDSLRSQAMEMDADACAVVDSLNQLIRSVGAIVNHRPELKSFLDTRDKWIFLWGFSIAVLFHIWGLKIDINDMSGSHPPTAMRFQMVLSTGATGANLNQEAEMFTREVSRAYSELWHGLTLIGSPSVRDQVASLVCVFNDPLAKAHHDKVMRCWNVIHEDLSRHACVAIAPKNPDFDLLP